MRSIGQENKAISNPAGALATRLRSLALLRPLLHTFLVTFTWKLLSLSAPSAIIRCYTSARLLGILFESFRHPPNRFISRMRHICMVAQIGAILYIRCVNGFGSEVIFRSVSTSRCAAQEDYDTRLGQMERALPHYCFICC